MMKKILFCFIVAALLCGCETEENGGEPVCPVTEVSVPASSAENPVMPGSPVTIQGKGFTSDSEIWLRSVVKAADVQAVITNVTATALTFTAPEVFGEQFVLLRENGDEWMLGTLVFAGQTDSGDGEDVEILPKKIIKSVFTDEESEYISFYSYDAEGRLTKIETQSGSYGDVLEIVYGQDEVTMQYTEPDFQSNTTFSLANGRAVRCIESEPGTQWETDYAYDAKGYQTGITFAVTEDGLGPDTYDGTLTIGEGGWLQRYAVTEKAVENGDSYGPYSIVFTPNKSVLNNLNLDLLGSGDFLEEIDELSLSYAYLLNIGGTRTKYLPQEFTLTDVEGYSYTVKYDYEFNGEYLSEIRIASDGITFSMRLYYEE